MSKFSVATEFRARDKFSPVVKRMESRVDRFGASARRALRSASAASDRLLGGLKRVGLAATAAGAAVGLVAKNIIDTGAGFEQAITNVAAVGLQTRDQIADLEAKAKDLGATTKFTATEAAAAMEIMAKSGFKQKDILSGVDGVLSAAAASGLEMAEVADVVAGSLKGMGLETDQAGRVADVLALASARTKSDMVSLGESMKNVASTARTLKVPFEDTVAAVAMLQDVGLDASVAGSAMNTMLTKLAKPPKEIAKQMDKLHLSFKKTNGDMKSFPDVLATISQLAKQSGGNLDQVAILADLVGLRGQKAATNLATLFETGKLEDLSLELYAAKGSAEKMAAIRMDTFEGDVTLLGSAVDALKTNLYETQGSPLRGVVQGMTKWVSKNDDLIVQKVEDTIKKIKDNAEELAMWGKRVAIGVGGVIAFSLATKAASAAIAVGTVIVKGASAAYTVLAFGVRQARIAYLALTIATSTDTAKTIANTIATHARSAAMVIGRVGAYRLSAANIASTASTVGNTIATNAGAAATWLKNAAVVALNATKRLGAVITAALTGATVAGTGATAASTIATWASQAAHFAKNIVVRAGTALAAAYSVATLRTVPASAAANAAMLPMLATVGAMAAAYIAVNAALDQYNQLSAELGSTSVGQFLGDALETGSFGEAFNRADERENAIARADAAKRAGGGMVSPQERVARSVSETTTTSKHQLNISAPPGSAALANPKTAAKAGITLQPSGAF